jgi:mono/diheme cytochrome c family protein
MYFNPKEIVMLKIFHVVLLAFVAVAGLMSFDASAETPTDILSALTAEAKSGNPAFKAFSAARGETFFKQKHGKDESCASCHTDNPAATGKHATSGKLIEALAPAANAERFTDPAKVAKWFRRNCNDVLERECTVQEKGDVLAYLMTVKK